jgi:hypothetical protein
MANLKWSGEVREHLPLYREQGRPCSLFVTSLVPARIGFGILLPLAEKLPGFPDAGPLFYGHFKRLPGHGHRLSFPAMRDSS